MLRRPAKDDTEEEILEMERKYMEEKDRMCAVNIINKNNKHKSEDSPPDHQLPSKLLKSTPSAPSTPSTLGDAVYYPSPLPNILGDIVEKNMDDAQVTKINKPGSSKGTRGTSIFAKRNRPSQTPNGPNGSAILKGEDADAIHNENKALLEGMSQEEIQQERQKLLSTMDPKLIDFVKSLRKSVPVETLPDKTHQNVPHLPMDIIQDLKENDVVSHPKLEDWLHFDTLERDKMEWMKSFKREGPESNPSEPYEARFGGDGRLLPYALEYNEENKKLFHHSEEPHRPGYTFNELFHFCRSAVVQQRTFALNAIAGILDHFAVRAFDGIVDIPVTKIYFVLRFSLDENLPIVIDPTVKALRNLLHHKVDEHHLDALSGTADGHSQPRLAPANPDREENETDQKELKDFHIAELDLIDGCYRTDILPRMQYIINIIKPDYTTVNYCLQILTALARHSVENCENFFKTPGLFEGIFKSLLSTSLFEKDPLKTSKRNKAICSALKLVRILSAQSQSMAQIFIEKYNVLDVILHYIANITVDKTSYLEIQIQSFHLCSLFFNYKLGLDVFKPVIFVLCKTFNDYVETINLNEKFHNMFCMHATALLATFTNFFYNLDSNQENITMAQIVDDSVKKALVKWSIQIASIEKCTFIHLNLLSAVLNCSNAILKIGCPRTTNDSQLLLNIFKNMLKSSGFSKISSHLTECSNLLSSYSPPKEHDVPNIMRLNATMYTNSYKVLPVIQEASPIPFISSLCKFLFIHQQNDLVALLNENVHIIKYLSKIVSCQNMNLHNNWFTGLEFYMLYNIVRMSSLVDLNEYQKDSVYVIAFKLSYTLPSFCVQELQVIMNDIIFDRKYISIHRTMNKLNIDDNVSMIGDLDPIRNLYVEYLKSNVIVSFTFGNWDRAILPRDWIYLPILDLYSKSQDLGISKLLTKERIFNTVVNSLKWILIMETSFSDITNDISLTDRFCRVICVFLVDNSLFLDSTVKDLLKRCSKLLFDAEKSNQFNFDKSMVGINFQDLYSQFLDQFQAVSYGDHVFSACVLVPLAQKHNVKWRKLIWSEYAGCLRALDCPEELLCYPLADYLNPPENDISLLKSYHRCLNGPLLRPNTITHKIASHHVNHMMQLMKNSKKDVSENMKT